MVVISSYPPLRPGLKHYVIVVLLEVASSKWLQNLSDIHSSCESFQGIQLHVGDSWLFDARRSPFFCSKTDKNSAKPALRETG